jgi:hypothetical protein
LREALAAGHGILITPNHASHADPYVLLDVADQLQQPFFFMVAWQVFADQGVFGRFVLRSHGSFSVNRESTDWTALRRSAEILRSSACPLVLFPEGDIFHVNDRVRPFHAGCGTIAQLAARRTERRVLCFPCGIRYRYVEDPTPELLTLASELEVRACRTARPDLPLVDRARRLMRGLLRTKEQEYIGRALAGAPGARTQRLTESIVSTLEGRHQIPNRRASVPARVQALRRQILGQLDRAGANAVDQLVLNRQLADLSFVIQLYSYPADYLDGHPSIERIAETWDRLEEDVLGVTTARARGVRAATVVFGEPIAADPERSPSRAARELTRRLESRVRQMVEPSGPLYPSVDTARRRHVLAPVAAASSY